VVSRISPTSRAVFPSASGMRVPTMVKLTAPSALAISISARKGVDAVSRDCSSA